MAKSSRQASWFKSDREAASSVGELVLGLEIELDLHVVGVAEESLPAGALGDLIDAVGYALAGEVPLRRLEAAAAERDMIDDAGIGTLLPVGLGDVVEMQHGMARAIQPRAREIELRARAVLESQHVLIELHGRFEIAGRHIVMVEHTNAHIHRASPRAFSLGRIPQNTSV